jgi:hypothetical protein
MRAAAQTAACRPAAGLGPAIMMVFRAGLVVVAAPGRGRLGQTRRYTRPSAAGRCRTLDFLPTVR